jgi:hypothetical protein
LSEVDINVGGTNGMSNERDSTLQDALDKNEVIYHKTRIDFPYTQESMHITQVYNMKTGVVLCCEIPWDVAKRRTGKDVYSKADECIMLWPDKSVDLYSMREMTWIRKICDVGVEFDNVWTQLWEYHGLRGEHMSAEHTASASFVALQTQVRRVREMLTGCEGVVAAVTEIERRLGVGHEKCDFRVWGQVEDELHSADYCLRTMWMEKAELQQQLAATSRLVDAAKAGGTGAADAAPAVRQVEERAGGAGAAAQHCRVLTLLGELAGMRAEG